MWLLPLLLVSLGMVVCLGLFLSLQSDLRVRARHNEEQSASMLLRLEQAAAHRGPPAPAPPAACIPLRSGMNVSRRAQALGLLRRGEDVSHVAAALDVPRREIELLIRVQELTARRAAEAWSAAPPSPAAKT